MKKIALVVILISASVSAHAYNSNKSITEWQVNSRNIPVINSTDYSFSASASGKFVTIFDLQNSCLPGKHLPNRIWIVDNQPIKFSEVCFEGMPVFEAQSSKGENFICTKF